MWNNLLVWQVSLFIVVIIVIIIIFLSRDRKPNRTDDILFLKEFKEKINQYLFLGFAPAEQSEFVDRRERELMHQRLAEDPEFSKLRTQINEMIPRANQLVDEFKIPRILRVQDPLATGGQSRSYEAFHLIVNNTTLIRCPKEEFFDIIDQTIGALKTSPPRRRFEILKPIQVISLRVWNHKVSKILLIFILPCIVYLVSYLAFYNPSHENWAIAGFLAIITIEGIAYRGIRAS